MQLNLFLPSRPGPDGAAGVARRMLRRLGPSWALSPVRRFMQAAGLMLFVFLFFYVCWPGGAGPHAEAMARREVVEAETFLALDPLVSVSAAVAARTWVPALAWAGAVLLVCLIFPRGFCGYLCPLGTLIDLLDWTAGRRAARRRPGRPRWVHLRYYVLAAVMASAAFGVLTSGFVAAIPVLTRGMQFGLAPLQEGLLRGWGGLSPLGAGEALSLVLFCAILALTVAGPRFWCRCLCPTGALFSVASALRLTDRKVASSCIGCGRCAESCPFDAIKADFTTRSAECTFCQTCGGVCPVGAIRFTGRWHKLEARPREEAPAGEAALSRRGFLAGAAGGLAGAFTIGKVFGAGVEGGQAVLPVRPPGAVPEREFLRMCVRCGSCLKACPTTVLQPLGFSQGLEGLWTPHAAADRAGCDPTCNICGQVCPTGAIRALPLAEKRAARMGLAVVNERTCLPHSGRRDCGMCVDACKQAGYDAIEFLRVHVETDSEGLPVDDSGYLAPVVLADKCVGCGICQARCYQVNVKGAGLLEAAAIRVRAGAGRDDRILRGSYRALRQAEQRRRPQRPQRPAEKSDGYLPDFLDE